MIDKRAINNILIGVGLLLIGAGSSSAIINFSTPESVVKSINSSKEYDPFHEENPATLENYFTKDLTILLLGDRIASCRSGGPGQLNFDPRYDTQDPEITQVKVKKAVRLKKGTTVTVTFLNHGNPHHVTYYVKKVGSTWKVEDLELEDGRDLINILRVK